MEVVVLGLLSWQLSLRSVFWDVWNRATNSWCWHRMKRSGSSVMKCWSEWSPWKPLKIHFVWYTKLLSLNGFSAAFTQNEGQEKEFQWVLDGWWFYTKALILKKNNKPNQQPNVKFPGPLHAFGTSSITSNQPRSRMRSLKNGINIPNVGHKYCTR